MLRKLMKTEMEYCFLQIASKAGQFFMIKGQKSDVVYNRPISVYHSEEKINVTTGKKEYMVQFMMLEKGRGTQELCHLTIGEEMKIMGPLGTPWPIPESINAEKNEICIVGGGIGVAPESRFPPMKKLT